MPTCAEDGYPMIPVSELHAGGMKWGCSNPWHPRHPGRCPSCGRTERAASTAVSDSLEARCRRCGHQWLP
jgi:hypothetical protein